ncbi:GH92 family glycosyl hydrolase [Pontibacter sp. SGAir0037]|uniref:GH92 family glycosyl hydrolase n=1 Tax=Pontibacter sp. SGAir0037 TaxID=2571030 RepID=UPI0010CCC890|nr:GH92 family glycosyl hydrolase [Pontibacter sp. SGAir0037]QCR21177.1 alpha-mannosidase [Pontibacter sp. SGAir0037]
MLRYICLLFLLTTALKGVAQNSKTNLEYVDPTIGGVGHILEPTRPTAHLPNSMVRVYPAKRDQLDDQLGFFPLTIISHRLGELFGILPHSGSVDRAAFERKYAYDQEKAAPHRYQVRLEESGIGIEFIPSGKAGLFVFTYPEGKENQVLFALRHKGSLAFEGKKALSGQEDFTGMSAWFYGEFSEPVSPELVADEKGVQRYAAAKTGRREILFRYAVSFISSEQAKKNLREEIPSWKREEVLAKATRSWNQVLDQVQLEGGTEAQRRTFYTSLYRSYERMVNITEQGRYYSAFDHQVHRAERPFYTDNWIWDTYLSLEPLHTILNPKMEADKIASYVRMYEQSGWLPSFAVLWGEHACMTGNHAAAWVADVWAKGVRDFDLPKAYEGLRKNALEGTLLPWRYGPMSSVDSFYHQNNYFPALRPGEKETVKEVHGFERRQAVAVTLQHSYDDWCLAQLARELRKPQEAELFLKKSANYRNVFRQEKGFMWPKDSEGRWIEPFDPKFSGGMGGRDYFTENNAYTYNWDVKHDLQGLFGMMGGKAAAEAKLDELFREGLGRSKYELWGTFPDATGLVGQFVMGNEPSFHVPYLYNYLGSPWKTQKRIRMLLDTWYTDNLFGIPGDEDGGGMTSFVVFSMMGFYPVTPGIPAYNIGSPSFEKVSVKLDNGKTFTVVARNNSPENKYIQRARLNGRVWDKPWFTHEDLVSGGTLELEMGSLPNKKWGTGENAVPPSAIDFNPLTKL